MTPEPTTQVPPPRTATPARRFVTGRYRVAVEKLGTDGLAYGPVIEASKQPTPAECAELGGQFTPIAVPPERLSFVGGIPGEVVEIEVSWSIPQPDARRRAARHIAPPLTRLVEVIEPSPLRVQPRCAVFGECGGCQLQHLSYPAQLDWKTSRVYDAVSVAGLADVPVLPAIGAASEWNYRNHMRFSVTRRGEAGLTARGTHRVLQLTNCPIAHQRINDVLELVFQSTKRLSPPQLVVRYSETSNHLLLQPPPDTEFGDRIAVAGLELRVSDMEESLAGVPFRIRPSSFFQTNTKQAERMAELVLARIPAGHSLTWVDAYCGVGTFARLIAEQVGSVIAIEESASAVRDARWNLRDVGNVDLLQGKVEELLPRLEHRLDGLVIDPPRAGCRRPVLDALIARPLPKIVYVSCNPDTLAEDLAYLCVAHHGYQVISIQPLDMFPQTAHIETITLLEAV